MIKFTLLYLVILFVPTGVFASKVSLNELKELIKRQDDKAIEQFLLETKTLRDNSLKNE